MPETLRGRLLVSTPALTDPNFDRTVVLLLEHGVDGGALGIVLNRPTATPIVEAIPDWAMLATGARSDCLGGPVGVGTIIAFARSRTDEPPDRYRTGLAPTRRRRSLARSPNRCSPTVSALPRLDRLRGLGARTTRRRGSRQGRRGSSSTPRTPT